MKKLALLGGIFIISLVCVFILTGCSSEDSEIGEIVKVDQTSQITENTSHDNSSDTPDLDDSDINISDDSNQTASLNDSNLTNVSASTTSSDNVKMRNLTVEFMDVRGNSVLIRTPRRETIVIDGGQNVDGLKLVKKLLAKGLVKIDYLFSSNPGTDNSGGLPSLIFNFNNSQAYCSGLTYNGAYVSYKSYQNYARGYSLPPIAITEDEIFDVKDDSIELQAFVPYEDGRSNGEAEDDTIVFRLDRGDASFLFLGDCKGLCFQKIEGNDLDVDVLNAHGPVSQKILDVVSPKIIVYDEITNETIKPDGVKVYSKSEGAILIMSDGSKYFISTLGKE